VNSGGAGGGCPRSLRAPMLFQGGASFSCTRRCGVNNPPLLLQLLVLLQPAPAQQAAEPPPAAALACTCLVAVPLRGFTGRERCDKDRQNVEEGPSDLKQQRTEEATIISGLAKEGGNARLPSWLCFFRRR
jgi:hypothetical protein